MENIYSDEKILLLDKPKEQKENCESQDVVSVRGTGGLSLCAEGVRILRLSFKPQYRMLYGEIVVKTQFTTKILYRMFNIAILISRVSPHYFCMDSISRVCLVITYDEKLQKYKWDGKTLFYQCEYTITEFETAFDAEIKIEKET